MKTDTEELIETIEKLFEEYAQAGIDGDKLREAVNDMIDSYQ